MTQSHRDWCLLLPNLLRRRNRDSSAEGQKIAADSFREFARKAGLMHAYNKQLEHLLVYGWDRVRRNDPEHADVNVVRTLTAPPILISTLDPKQDTHVGEDLMATGCWEPVMTPIFLHVIDLIKRQRAAAGDHKRPALLDIGAVARSCIRWRDL